MRGSALPHFGAEKITIAALNYCCIKIFHPMSEVKHLQNFLGSLWETSFIFGKVQKVIGNVCKASGQQSGQESLEILGLETVQNKKV